MAPLYRAIVSGWMFLAGSWVIFGVIGKSDDLNETLDPLD
jgi:hypothetical protein